MTELSGSENLIVRSFKIKIGYLLLGSSRSSFTSLGRFANLTWRKEKCYHQ